MDYNDSSRQFRPLGSRVMALSIKCVSLAALRTESREEWIFLMRLTACQCENGQSEREGVQKHQWV